mmetsp:Transcript_28798/g.39546  ORF Transcript_28798/g.39546 Transcript_28798/m.39546 type:complete len:97 (+) Transcript_28798:20-310(+)
MTLDTIYSVHVTITSKRETVANRHAVHIMKAFPTGSSHSIGSSSEYESHAEYLSIFLYLNDQFSASKAYPLINSSRSGDESIQRIHQDISYWYIQR